MWIEAMLVLIQGYSKRGWNYTLFSTFSELSLKVELGTHLRDNNGHLFLWDLNLFWPSFKIGQTIFENMHFCRLSCNRNFKVDLDTHLKDKHGHLCLWDLELFWPSFKVG